MRGKRGQAALEYLTTYGWVLLTVFVAIGALAYFGFLDPDKFVPDRCWFGPQLVCTDYQLQAGSPGQANWKLRNNFAQSVEIGSVAGVDSKYPLNGCSASPTEVGVGEVTEISCDIGVQVFSGDKYSIPAEIEFRRNDTGSAPWHNVTGEIFTLAR